MASTPNLLMRNHWALKSFSISLIMILAFMCISCHRWYQIDASDPSDALVPLEKFEIPRPSDDLDRGSLLAALEHSLTYVERLPPDRTFHYGPHVVTADRVRETLETFRQLVINRIDEGDFRERIREDFIWFRAAGSDIFGTVLFTGYYEPLLEGRLEPDGGYRYPLYGLPPDRLVIDLGAFGSHLQGQRIVGRIEGRRVVPYYERAEIDGEGALAQKDLEIVWVKDPIDLFFLHVQGSGIVTLEDGRKLHVNYAGTNGRPYRSIGRLLIDKGAIRKEEMSMQAIRAYLKDHPDCVREILFSNPSYVFFEASDEGPFGNISVPLTPERSIATDSRLFPKGGLAFIKAEHPIGNPPGKAAQWETFSRFVLNQDTGGAITGAGRVDLFCGAGKEAAWFAGHLRRKGELYFLIKKPHKSN